MLRCLTILCMNSEKDESPGLEIWLSVIRDIIHTEITPTVSGSSRLSPLFSRKRISIVKNWCRTFCILSRFSVDLIPMKPWNFSKIWWNGCWIRSVIRIFFSPSDRWLKMFSNWRKIRSLYRNSTAIQLALSKRPLVWMYFYSGSSFLWDFAKRSNYSSFLNGSFWRGLNAMYSLTNRSLISSVSEISSGAILP